MAQKDFTLDELTVSATADSRGLDNRPASSLHYANLELTRKFLQDLPFDFTLTSVYRSPVVNSAVGGSSTSQHMNGLGIDLVPTGMTNKELATWLWANQASYPELDQVIWYRDKGHAHIGICPAKATNCVSGAPRADFYEAKNEGSTYTRWLPDNASLSQVVTMYAQSRPRVFMGAKILALTLGAAGVVGLGVLLWRWKNK